MSVPATSARINRYKQAEKQYRPTYTLQSAMSTQPVWKIALKNELGVGVSKRPFMTSALPTLVQTKDQMVKSAMQKMRQDLTPPQAKQLAGKIGAAGVSVIQKSITGGGWRSNAPFTVAVKQSSKPLIDTGLMRQSVTYTVEQK